MVQSTFTSLILPAYTGKTGKGQVLVPSEMEKLRHQKFVSLSSVVQSP